MKLHYKGATLLLISLAFLFFLAAGYSVYKITKNHGRIFNCGACEDNYFDKEGVYWHVEKTEHPNGSPTETKNQRLEALDNSNCRLTSEEIRKLRALMTKEINAPESPQWNTRVNYWGASIFLGHADGIAIAKYDGKYYQLPVDPEREMQKRDEQCFLRTGTQTTH